MENTDSQNKQAALDSKSAYAGNVSPDPEMGIEKMGKQAGLNVKPGKPLSVAEDMEQRDQQRYELDVESKANGSVSDQADTPPIDITQTETGQIEAVRTRSVQSGQAGG